MILWIGRIVTWFFALFLVFDATIHIINPPFVVAASEKLGFPKNLALPLGIVELIGVGLMLYPRTTMLGLLLMTAYLGGATAIQVRINGDAWFSVLVGLALWVGAYLQYPQIRALLPFQR